MVAPLKAGDEGEGRDGRLAHGGRAVPDSELEFLVGLSLQATVAIENARLFAESQQRAAELDTVNTVSQQLSGKLDVASLLELVGEQVAATLRRRHRVRRAARAPATTGSTSLTSTATGSIRCRTATASPAGSSRRASR